jgi:hypothetical protein
VDTRKPAWALAVALFLLVFAAFPLAGQDVNLAQGKPVVASSSSGAAFSPEKAVDGKQSTRWSSQNSDPQWIRVDLGASTAVARVVLSWNEASAKDYRVEISNNDTTWSTIARRTNMAAGARVDDLKGLSAQGRYVRVYGSARTSKLGYSLIELKIYGPPKGAPSAAKSGLFFGFTAGMPIPVGSSADLLNLGVQASLEFGWQFALGPGRLKLGVETGVLWECTKDADVYAPYNSFFIPVTALVGYDLLIAGKFQIYAEALGGYSATIVSYGPPDSASFGVLKPFAGGGLGAGMDIGSKISVRAGARFLAVFYDVNPFLCVVPEVGVELRL